MLDKGDSGLNRFVAGNQEDQLDNCRGPLNKSRMTLTSLELAVEPC